MTDRFKVNISPDYIYSLDSTQKIIDQHHIKLDIDMQNMMGEINNAMREVADVMADAHRAQRDALRYSYTQQKRKTDTMKVATRSAPPMTPSVSKLNTQFFGINYNGGAVAVPTGLPV